MLALLVAILVGWFLVPRASTDRSDAFYSWDVDHHALLHRDTAVHHNGPTDYISKITSNHHYPNCATVVGFLVRRKVSI